MITLQDEPPNWTSDSDMGLESISEPDIDLPDDDDEDEFSDAQDHVRSGSDSPDNSLPSPTSKFTEEGDTEDDPVDPVTPGAGKSSFVNIIPPGMIQKSASTSTTGSTSSGVESLSFDDEDEVEWVGHDVMTPQQEYNTSSPEFEHTLAESQATINMRASEDSGVSHEHVKHKRKSTKKKSSAKAPPQQYPFPATPGEEESKSPPRRVPQMRTAKARDGGRTQSGGVRGVPADDIDDF